MASAEARAAALRQAYVIRSIGDPARDRTLFPFSTKIKTATRFSRRYVIIVQPGRAIVWRASWGAA